MESWAAEEKNDEFGGNEDRVVMGGAHQIMNSRGGQESWLAEEKKMTSEGMSAVP